MGTRKQLGGDFKRREPIGMKPESGLESLDHRELKEDEYKATLRENQLRLLSMQRCLSEEKRSLVLVFEGPDAAGKGGAIQRVTERLDPRLMRVHSIVKPTSDEGRYHYLWRFWNRLAPYGQTVIFDRSWYGRVLVERVEGFARKDEWQRAYREINEFERQLMDDGAILIKFYLFISKDEQLKRFKARESDPYKHWKISDEDWRNRKHWDENVEAAEEMLQETSTEAAPWRVIAANYKWYTRVHVVQSIVERLSEENIEDVAH
jgi:polyphosphate kinase 2 (PPK2 family)